MGSPAALTGTAFDHAAHAAQRIADLLPLYAETLGGRLLYSGDNRALRYRAIVLGFDGDAKVELLEPHPGSPFFDRFFERNPAGGLHHLTFKVADVRAARDRAEAAGLEVFGFSEDNPNWREVFVHPRVAHGALLQFVEAPPGFPAGDPARTIEQVLAEPTGALPFI